MFKEQSAENVAKSLKLLPPITTFKVSNDTRMNIFETKIKNLEDANFKLIEIVFQLKNGIENLKSNSIERHEGTPRNTLNQGIENRIKKLEQMMESQYITGNKELIVRNTSLEPLSNKLSSLTDEIEHILSSKSRVESSVMKIADEILQMKRQFGIQSELLSSTTNQFTNKTRRLHDEYINNLDSITDKMIVTQDTARQLVDCTVVHQDFEDSLAHLRHEVLLMKQKFETQTQELSNTESNLAFRINEFVQKLNDEKRIREVEIRRLEILQQDTLHNQDSTRMVLENHLSGLLSESQAKQMDRETLTRIDIIRKVTEFEKMLLSEKEIRNSREKEIHARINEVAERASEHEKVAVEEIRETMHKYSNKTNETLHKIESGIKLIEHCTDEKFRKHYQVIAAEVTERKKMNHSIKSDLFILEERIRAATAAMQLAISGLANRIQNKSETDELKIQMDKRIGDFQLYMSRNFSDVDSQLQNMMTQISGINVNVEARIAQATSELASEVRETLSSVITWQANSTAHLREMQTIRVTIMQELSKMQLTLNHIEAEIPTQMTIETDERIRAIGDIRHQMESLKIALNSQPSVKEVDVDKIQESIRKLAETLQSMKCSMGMKIQSEQDMRLEQIKDLQTEMRFLEEQFMKRSKHLEMKKRNYIIKPSESDNEDWYKGPIAFISLNQWSIYSIWKWIIFKKKLQQWKENAHKNKGKKKVSKFSFWKKSKK